MQTILSVTDYGLILVYGRYVCYIHIPTALVANKYISMYDDFSIYTAKILHSIITSLYLASIFMYSSLKVKVVIYVIIIRRCMPTNGAALLCPPP